MKASQLFFKTVKNSNQNAETISQELFEKSGYIQKLSKGLFIYAPLMWKVVKNISQIIREELDKIGGQEISMPLLQPRELWEETDRWNAFTKENLLYTLSDRENRQFCVAPTHEEVVCFFVSQWLSSYKQLPLHLYQISEKFRNEIRPRFGLIRTREFIMQDSYTFSTTEAMMNEQYNNLKEAYTKIFNRINLKFVIVEADGGKIGKSKSEEFQALANIGEDLILYCGSYGVNVEAAISIPPSFEYEKHFKPITEVSTPNVTTIENLSQFFSTVPQMILKTLIYKLVYTNEIKFIAVGIRGDRQLNPLKIQKKFNACEVLLAEEEEITKHAISHKGFIGPINSSIEFYADLTTKPMINFICAANKKDVHFINVNWERDISVKEFYDFLLAEEGDECPQKLGEYYKSHRGIEIGHIFNLKQPYSKALKTIFQTETGNSEFCWMGTYGIGIGRTIAAYVEQNHDDRGIIWSLPLAPFKIFITAASKNEKQVSTSLQIYQSLKQQGFEPLLDDRNERLGFKLKDSDLIGIPYKLIVGKTLIESNSVEIESRLGKKEIIPLSQLNQWCLLNLKK